MPRNPTRPLDQRSILFIGAIIGAISMFVAAVALPLLEIVVQWVHS